MVTTQLLSVPDTAARLAISQRYVRQLIADGRLRAVKIGRRTLVETREIEAFVAGLRKKVAA